MSTRKYTAFLVLLFRSIYSIAAGDVVSLGVSDLADKLELTSSSPRAASSSSVDRLRLSSLGFSFTEDMETSSYCSELLGIFGQRYEACLKCLISAARPVKVCENCYSTYGGLVNIYNNISSDQVGPGNVSCRDSLLRSDRLMLVYMLFNSMKEVWKASSCEECIIKEYQGLTNDSLYFLRLLNQTVTCFEKYEEGNHTELCKNCKDTYSGLNKLYNRMEKNNTLCIDIDDAMNMTRKMWSKGFNCSSAHDESVPVISVSSFMLFLPVICYLSNLLHSKQKTRRLIHPSRAKLDTNLMNIQDKQT